MFKLLILICFFSLTICLCFQAVAYALNLAAKREEVLLPINDLDDDATIIITPSAEFEEKRKAKQKEKEAFRTQEEKQEVYIRRGTIICLTERS